MDHPSETDLQAYAAGPGQDPAIRARVAAHVARCSACRERVAELGDPDATQALSGVASTLGLAAVAHATRLPDPIGPYTLIDKLGEGGMGTVYLAEQSKPIRRQVALKVIKPGMDSAAIVARFEGERQALALMNHPGIAKVLDAGTTADRRPYFVMEVVQGESITAYCDRQRLTTAERIALFQQVCDAVQHAHQKAVIHRDLKPSNILVSCESGTAAIKVIDFGIAKALEQRLGDHTLFTEHGHLLGTPEYMSPEQAETALDVDTRSDVYALGVVLYQLLTGVLPFAGRDLRRQALSEIQRIIREVEPPRPSMRLATAGDEATTVARNRSTDGSALRRALQGDLDWITMKAMEKDRTRRYASAAALAADLERFRANEPVEAGPPSRRYRMRKFVRRNRGGVMALSTLFVVLVSGMTVSTLMYLRSERERRRADNEATTAVTVQDLLLGLFEALGPGETLAPEVPVRTILDIGRERVAKELKDRPAVQARMFAALGTLYANIGAFPEAGELLTAAVDLFGDGAVESATERLPAQSALAEVLAQSDRPAALALHEQVLAVRREHFGERSLPVAASRHDIGAVLLALGEIDRAEVELQAAYTLRRSLLDDLHPDLASSHLWLGYLALQRGALPEAEQQFLTAQAIRGRTLPADHPEMAVLEHYLGDLYGHMQRYGDAARALRSALRKYRKTLGDDHAKVAACLNTLGWALKQQADATTDAEQQAVLLEEAVGYLRSALDLNARVFSPDSLQLASDANTLAAILRGLGQFDEAQRLHHQALGIRRAQLGPDDRMVGVTQAALGKTLLEAGRPIAAEPVLIEAMRILDTHPTYDAGWVIRAVVAVYEQRGMDAEAERWRQRLTPP